MQLRVAKLRPRQNSGPDRQPRLKELIDLLDGATGLESFFNVSKIGTCSGSSQGRLDDAQGVGNAGKWVPSFLQPDNSNVSNTNKQWCAGELGGMRFKYEPLG